MIFNWNALQHTCRGKISTNYNTHIVAGQGHWTHYSMHTSAGSGTGTHYRTHHGCSPSAKLSHTVACGTGHSQGPSDNGRPVCREKALFVLTTLWPGNGLFFTAEKSDCAAFC